MSVKGALSIVGAAAVVVTGLTFVETGPRSDIRPTAVGAAAPTADQARAGLLKAPLSFVANTGALDDRVAFWLPGSQASVYLTDEGLTYRLTKPTASAEPSAPTLDPPPAAEVTETWVVRQDFLGSATPVRPVATRC